MALTPTPLDLLRAELHSPAVQVAQGVYFTLVISGGLVLLPLVLITFAVSKNGSRNSPVINFLAGLSVYAFGDSMLFLTGQISNPEPPRQLCLIQLAMIYGGIAMSSIAAVMLVLELLLTLPGRKDAGRPRRRAVSVTIAALPPTSLLVYFIVHAWLATLKGHTLPLARGQFICRFTTGSPAVLLKGPLFLLLATLGIAVIASVYMLIRVQATLKRIGEWQWKRITQSKHGAWMSILLRLLIFEAVCAFASITVILEIINPQGIGRELTLGCAGAIPLLAFFIFGTVASVRAAWFGRCHRRQDQSRSAEAV